MRRSTTAAATSGWRALRRMARNPGLSFSEAMGSEGQLEGLYRFLNNDEVTFETVHAPHAERTRSRCLAHKQVLVLHDTTVLKYNGDREGLGRIRGAMRPRLRRRARGWDRVRQRAHLAPKPHGDPASQPLIARQRRIASR